MRAGSLFSGVGGMDLGLARAGFDHASAHVAEWVGRRLLKHLAVAA